MNIYRLSFISCLVMAIPSALAVEFNLNVLDKSMRDRIDISLLKEKGGIAPGEYFVSVAVNNNQISNGQKIDWKKNGDQTIPCINDLLVDKFGLKPEVRQSLPRLNQCVDFSSRPEILFIFDQASQQLNITIPQAWLAWHSDNWTPPSTWKEGVAGVLMDYNLFASSYRPQDGSNSTNLNAYGTAGINAGAWRLRSDYQLNQTDSDDNHEQSGEISRTYLFRPLPHIGNWRDISISTSFNTTHYEDKDRDNQIYLSISLPFGNGGRVGYDMQNSSHSTTHRMSWNDTLDERNSWGMSTGLQSDRPDNGAQVSGNYQHLSSAGEWDISGTYAANDYSSVSSSWSGSFTATQYGAAFHRRSSTNEPRLMVSTDGVADIPVQGNLDYTNHFGIAVVPLISSYQPSTVAVNMNDLPDGVTVADNVIKETWIEGAIGYKSLASRSGKDVNVIIRNASGQLPPLGADIRQEDSGISVGMVGEEGHAWLSGVAENQQFTVIWGDSQRCSIHLPEHMEDTANRLILPCH
ncbi:TPA: fimbrial biogenesis outer membrane usher protein [Escherichia coli]|nr:fimbrial biogenesis outer membrane usher protein [Escherichia coli]